MGTDNTKALDEFPWTVDFEGLLHLLAKNLYTQTDVVVRELLQNAHDAIVLRVHQYADAPPGRIDVILDAHNRILTVGDNGIGMDLSDIRSFLAVIGATNKIEFQDEVTRKGRKARKDVIGQFGIGLLAAFVAADKISITTRKAGVEEAFLWVNDGSQKCRVFEGKRSAVGTSVEVHLNESTDYDFLVNEHSVEKIIKRYMDFLPIPIHINKRAEPINVIRAPWDRAGGANYSVEDKQADFRFLNNRYRNFPLEIIPISITTPHRAQGLLYISDDRIPDIQTGGNMEVFVHRVCVTERDNAFLPKWAKFVSGIIDSPDLTPNAARDNVVRDEVFQKLQDAIGETIVERLKEMARQEPKRFSKIVDFHHFHLIGMAIKYDDFFEEVKDLLPFYTNRVDNDLGNSPVNQTPLLMSLREYREHVGRDKSLDYKTPIYFTASGGAASQFNILANAQDLLILNTPRVFERDFLRKYANLHHSEVELVQLDNTVHTKLFEELSAAEQDAIAPLLGDIHSLLDPSRNVRIEARRFQPQSLPAALIGEYVDDQEAAQQQVTEVMQIATGDEFSIAKSLSRRQTRFSSLTLLINFDNPIVQRLNSVDRRDKDRSSSLLALYNGAFLKSGHLLGAHNTSVIYQQFLGFLEANLDKRQKLDEKTAEIESLKQTVKDLLDQKDPKGRGKPNDHVILFMMTPFSSDYDNVELAMRDIFEQYPYFFEVRLARDYREDGFLHENVQRHIAMADGFLADVTELNKNVLLELGATLYTNDARPKFCLRGRDSSVGIPADMRHVIRIEYSSRTKGYSEIANEVRKQLAGADIEQLLSERKERYISETLLKGAVGSVSWTEQKLSGLRRRFPTLEKLLSATPEQIAEAINDDALVGELVKKRLKDVAKS